MDLLMRNSHIFLILENITNFLNLKQAPIIYTRKVNQQMDLIKNYDTFLALGYANFIRVKRKIN